VIIGGHRDGWGPGTADNVSGTVSVLEAARAVAEEVKAGARPSERSSRDVDAEEWGDPARLNRRAISRLSREAVAYSIGRRARGRDSAAADRRRFADVARRSRSVPDRTEGSVYAEWRERGDPFRRAAMGDPGGGSVSGLPNHLGIPIAGDSEAGGVYHSQMTTMRG
jgi:N-acetylated-alpha-linked acidic dipeptidase